MIKEIFEYFLSLLKSRFFPLILVFILLFVLILTKLFDLQIVNGEYYSQSVSDAQEKTMSVAATRGRIFDRNGNLLAYNDVAFSVEISDTGTYESQKVKNETINSVINKTIDLIVENGDKISNDLPIALNVDDHLEFTENENAILRFKRDIYGAASVSALSDEQLNATAEEVYQYLSKKYGVSPDFSLENQLEIINLRRYMQANSYTRYMNFTIAYEVSDNTVASIMEHSNELVGVTVEEKYIRKYVDSIYTSNILGYTGNVSQSELEELQAQNAQYESNDIVGKSGIEQAMELTLQGIKGSNKVYVDSVGRITEIVDNISPQTGNDVYLTIDANLQKDVYNIIEDELVKILLQKIIPDDTVYKYNERTGSIEDIFIPIKSVYFALLDNNVVSVKGIAKQNTTNEENVYNKYLDRLAIVSDRITSELTDNDTAYKKLTDEMKAYIYYIYDNILSDSGVINTKNLDTNDQVYKNWTEDEISLKEFLTYALTKNWIDMDKLTTNQYSSLSEAYNELLKYIINEISTDSGFSKKVYKYMIMQGYLTGSEVCQLLYDQNIITEDDNHALMLSGKMSSYDFMRNLISTKTITPAQLALEPCSGACVVADPNNGQVLALVTYPGYDNNKLSGTVDKNYYEQLRNDNSKPLINKATSMLKAPGSIFKMCTAITGIEEGIISNGTTFMCTGIFDTVTPSPKCWIYPGSHGTENIATAIRDSCNVYFYNVGYKLAMNNGKIDNTFATDTLKKYAQRLGLATKSGIEIYESEPHPSTQDAIASAIGQGSHAYSALNLCRYVSTIATSGTCYDFTLISKITDSNANVLESNEPKVASQLNIHSSTWDSVHYGMQLVTQSTAAFKDMPYLIAGKSGTAQENTKKADHITYVSYAPYDTPKYAVSVMMPNGYASSNAAELSANVYKAIWGIKE